MSKKQNFTIYCLICAGMIMLAAPAHCQWPTLDLSQVTNMINGWTAQVESTSSTIQSTLSVGNIQQQIGDAVGGLSKFADAKEQAEKAQEKVEKQQKRMERLAELKKEFEEQAANAKQFAADTMGQVQGTIDAGKEMYNEGMEMYEEGKGYYEEGMALYEEGMGYYEEGMGMLDEAKDMLGAGDDAAAGTEETSEDEEMLSSDEFMEGEALDDEAIADLISDTEFSEGSWNGEAVENAVLTTDGLSAVSEGNVAEVSIGRRPFTGEKAETAPVAGEISTMDAVAGEKAPEADGAVATDEGMKVVKPEIVGGGSASLNPADRVSGGAVANATDGMKATTGTATAVSVAPTTSVAPVSASEVGQAPVRRAFTTDNALQNKALTTSVTPTAATVAKPAGTVSANTSKTAAPTAASVSTGAAPAAAAASQTSAPVRAKPAAARQAPARRAFTTSSAEFSHVVSRPMAFAQMASFKTGTNNDGKFIYSDIIANKCGINFDEVDEDKIKECVKIWVLGMGDPNAETATEWKNQYSEALRDHVAGNLADAMVKKNYSASFDTEVADDLDNKSQALSNEREEISFSGKTTQTNQEIMIRLMEAMTSQAITKSWSSVAQIDKSYYEEEEADE